jgi:hypothetical protein
MFFITLFVIFTAVIGVLSYMVINLRAQTGVMVQSVEAIEKQLMTMAAVVAVRTSGQPAASVPVASTAWDNAVAELSPCGKLTGDVPDDDVLRVLGLGGILDSGYSAASICFDEQHNHIPFIMAKEELTPPTEPTPDSRTVCVDFCDKVVFGLLHPDTKILKYIESSHHLGIYAEAYDQACHIDQVMDQASADDEAILLYCGSGESGGLSHWYQYEINGDKLTEVQALKDIGPPKTYDVKEPALLGKFIIKGE